MLERGRADDYQVPWSVVNHVSALLVVGWGVVLRCENARMKTSGLRPSLVTAGQRTPRSAAVVQCVQSRQSVSPESAVGAVMK